MNNSLKIKKNDGLVFSKRNFGAMIEKKYKG